MVGITRISALTNPTGSILSFVVFPFQHGIFMDICDKSFQTQGKTTTTQMARGTKIKSTSHVEKK